MTSRDELLPCPFDNGFAELIRYRDRVGYDEYETNPERCVVKCNSCGARAQQFTIKAFSDFVPREVDIRYLRENPHKRAEWEEKHEAYIATVLNQARLSWNTRALKERLDTKSYDQLTSDDLLKIIADCRRAAGFGTALDPMGHDGFAALGDPQEVPTFIENQFKRALSTPSESREGAGVDVANALAWKEKGKHQIYRTDGCEFAEVPELEHSVGPAGFEVYRSDYGWECTFWHGNRGHQVAPACPSKDAAKEAAQAHINNLLSAIALLATQEAK